MVQIMYHATDIHLIMHIDSIISFVQVISARLTCRLGLLADNRPVSVFIFKEQCTRPSAALLMSPPCRAQVK